MFCHNCGFQLVENSKFCSNCGTQLAAKETTQSSSRTEQVVESENSDAEEEIKVWIKCKSCGENYYVENEDEWAQNLLVYSCDKCNGEIEVSFFGFCHECEEYVGFGIHELTDVLFDIAKSALGGFLNPAKGIAGLQRFIDNIPSASAGGVCPFCNKEHIKCPECGLSIKVRSDDDGQEVYACPKCSTKMRIP